SDPCWTRMSRRGALRRWIPWLPCETNSVLRVHFVFGGQLLRGPEQPSPTWGSSPPSNRGVSHRRAANATAAGILFQRAVEEVQGHLLQLARGGAHHAVGLLRIEHELEQLARLLQRV